MPRLKKELSLWQGVGLLATSLLGTGIFVVPATAAALAGRTSLWAWLVLIGLVLPMAFTFARLGRRYPHAGGVPHLIGQAFGPSAERYAAFLFIAVLPVGLPAALNIAAGFWHSWFALGPPQLWAIQILTLLGIGLLGIRSAGASGHLQLAIAVALAGLTGGILVSSQLHWQDVQAPWPDASDWSPFSQALGVIFWCFVGIEAFAHMGEEFRNPQRDYPLALVLGVLLAGLIYAVHSVVLLKFGLYGSAAQNARAVPDLLAKLYGPTARSLVAGLGYLSCFACINIYLQGFARLIWSMADEGKLPRSLAQLNGQGAPFRALLVILLACGLTVTLSFVGGFSIDELIRYANGNFVMVYLLTMLAGYRLLSGAGRWLAGLSVLLCLFVLLTLGIQLLYVLLLTVGYLGFRYWHRWTQKHQSLMLE